LLDRKKDRSDIWIMNVLADFPVGLAKLCSHIYALRAQDIDSPPIPGMEDWSSACTERPRARIGGLP